MSVEKIHARRGGGKRGKGVEGQRKNSSRSIASTVWNLSAGKRGWRGKEKTSCINLVLIQKSEPFQTSHRHCGKEACREEKKRGGRREKGRLCPVPPRPRPSIQAPSPVRPRGRKKGGGRKKRGAPFCQFLPFPSRYAFRKSRTKKKKGRKEAPPFLFGHSKGPTSLSIPVAAPSWEGIGKEGKEKKKKRGDPAKTLYSMVVSPTNGADSIKDEQLWKRKGRGGKGKKKKRGGANRNPRTMTAHPPCRGKKDEEKRKGKDGMQRYISETAIYNSRVAQGRQRTATG